ALACSTAWPRSLALSPSASPEFQLTGVAPPSNSIYATTPLGVLPMALPESGVFGRGLFWINASNLNGHNNWVFW
ncbi:hypothetical protein, partial [Ralstonia pseudosolanacearum]|uniref:hypothetical protein n=1 Tax=Ralstonia pseudosolanacearum TaxID=1310165 RepID=UPI001E55ACE6